MYIITEEGYKMIEQSKPKRHIRTLALNGDHTLQAIDRGRKTRKLPNGQKVFTCGYEKLLAEYKLHPENFFRNLTKDDFSTK